MFVIICKKCNSTVEVKEPDDLRIFVYAAGYGGEVGLHCDICLNEISEVKDDG